MPTGATSDDCDEEIEGFIRRIRAIITGSVTWIMSYNQSVIQSKQNELGALSVR